MKCCWLIVFKATCHLQVSTSPLLFEFGVEKLYPISEGMIGGWLNIWLALFSFFSFSSFFLLAQHLVSTFFARFELDFFILLSGTTYSVWSFWAFSQSRTSVWSGSATCFPSAASPSCPSCCWSRRSTGGGRWMTRRRRRRMKREILGSCLRRINRKCISSEEKKQKLIFCRALLYEFCHVWAFTSCQKYPLG